MGDSNIAMVDLLMLIGKTEFRFSVLSLVVRGIYSEVFILVFFSFYYPAFI